MTRELLTDEQIEALRQAHGEVAAHDTIAGTAVFRAPTREEYVKSLALHMSGSDKGETLRWLASACVVHPDVATFGAWCDKRPGIPRAVDGCLNRLAGYDADAVAVDSDDFETTTVTTAKGPAVFKVPDPRQFKTYRQKGEGKDKQEAVEYLALCCVVSPDRETLKTWLQTKPGIAATVMPHIHRLAGIDENERLK